MAVNGPREENMLLEHLNVRVIVRHNCGLADMLNFGRRTLSVMDVNFESPGKRTNCVQGKLGF